MTMQEEALRYAAAGYDVFPLAPKCKVPTRNSAGLRDATCEVDRVRAWWERRRTANIGLAVPAGLVIVDIDTHKGGDAAGILALSTTRTVTARTAHGGYHLWYRAPAGISLDREPEKGVQMCLGGSHYVVVAPSVVTDDRVVDGAYTWEVSPFECEPAEMSEDMVRRFIVVDTWLKRALDKAKGGNRNDTGLWLACQLRDNSVSEDETLTCMDRYQAQVTGLGDHPYTMAEARATVHQVYHNQTSRPPAQATSVFIESSLIQSSPAKTNQDENNHIEEEVARWADPFFGIDDPKRRDMLTMARRIDALPAHGIVTHPQSPACARRRAQTNYWCSVVWPSCFPGCVFPSTQASTALNLIQNEHGPGSELETLTRHLFEVYDNPKRGEWGGVRRRGKESTPVAPFIASLRNALRLPPAEVLVAKQQRMTVTEVEPEQVTVTEAQQGEVPEPEPESASGGVTAAEVSARLLKEFESMYPAHGQDDIPF